MAWTVDNNLDIYLAETGSLKSSLTNGTLRFYTAGAALVVSCPIGTITANGDGTIDVPATGTPATLAGTGNVITNAKIYSSAGTLLLTTGDVAVGAAGTNDINFDDTSVDAGGVVAPGVITFSMSAITAAKT